MQITLQRKAYVKGCGGKANEANPKQYAVADLEVDCDKDQLEEMLGDGLALAAFAGCIEEVVSHPDGDSTDFVWKTKAIRPSSKVVAEMHGVTLDGSHTFVDQPAVFKISPVIDAKKVVVTFRFCIDQGESQVRHFLDDHRGQKVELSVRPVQENLPGVA